MTWNVQIMWPFRKYDCSVKGHDMYKQTRSGYYSGPHLGKDDYDVFHFRCTVHWAKQERDSCRHCPETTAWHEAEGHCIQTFSCGTSMMRAIERGEFVNG